MLLIFEAFLMLGLIEGKYIQGELRTWERWSFLARFCFLSEDGQFEYHIQYENDYAPQNLLLYYDSKKQWSSIYKTNKTCEQKESVLSRRQNQMILLTSSDGSAGCFHVPNSKDSGKKKFTITCQNSRRFRSARERWWFIAISNCNSTKFLHACCKAYRITKLKTRYHQGLSMRYKLMMTNGPPGDFWREHFSADEFYILPVLISFLLTYVLLTIAVFMCAMELKSKQLFHSTYKIFLSSVALQGFGIFNQCIAYSRYAMDGVGLPYTRDLGRLFESASEVLFLILLLLLAKGYTVTRGRLKLNSSIKLTVFMCLYVISYYSLFQYEKEYFDPGEVLYTYESPVGYGLIGLRIAAWWMFIYASIFTLKHYPEKSSFYYPFNLIASLWFITGPIFVICANNFIDKWVRESVMCFVQHSIAVTGHILFLMLTLPNKANKNFPYHVRTTQIGVMELTDGALGNNTLDHFCHHPYAPGGGAVLQGHSHNHTDWNVPMELFTISSNMSDKFDQDLKKTSQDKAKVLTCVTVAKESGQMLSPEEISMIPDFTAPSRKQRSIYSPN
ncbi:transmembrane protein 145-like [Nilaparvata lugens]|uniref:transmembrane protein 145-like n=1 Tax=Nilaparvata lugens TaxID=108931 RepID=UPI00193D207E|nr:transmembrane protein 145-like [Nilaparvata lugens]